jgi:hypothetical protein
MPNQHPQLAPGRRALETAVGMCPYWWTLQDTNLIIHTEFPGISTLGVGQLVIHTSVEEQLDILAIHIRFSPSNWTLQLSSQEPTYN